MLLSTLSCVTLSYLHELKTVPGMDCPLRGVWQRTSECCTRRWLFYRDSLGDSGGNYSEDLAALCHVTALWCHQHKGRLWRQIPHARTRTQDKKANPSPPQRWDCCKSSGMTVKHPPPSHFTQPALFSNLLFVKQGLTQMPTQQGLGFEG